MQLDGYRTNLHNEKFVDGNDFFEFCNGNKYKSLEARVIIIDELVDELLSAHNGWDNFYNEVPPARKLLSYIGNEADIPHERREKIIRAVLICRIGNGVSYNSGVSPAGRPVYDSFIEKLGDDNIVQALLVFYRPELYVVLSNQYCKKNAVEILSSMRKNVVSDKLKQIVDYLIANAANIDKVMRSTEFKALAATHISFG